MREVARAAVADVDDRALGARRAIRTGPDQKARDLLDRPLGGRQPDAQRPIAAQRRRAARARAPDARRACSGPARGSRRRSRCAWWRACAPGLRAEQDVERLRRGDDDVRRRAAHRSRSPGGVSPVRTQVRISTSGRPCARKRVADAGERRFQVALDVVRERLERRHVDDLRLVPRARLRGPGAPARRSPRGRRRASCPTRSARRSACAGRPGSPATPRPAPASAPLKLRSNQAATAG